MEQNNETQQEQAQQEQPKQEQPEQQQSPTIQIGIDEINEILKKNYAEINTNLYKEPEPQEKKKEEPEEDYIPFDINNILDDDDDELNPKKLKKALKQVYAKAVEDVYKTIPVAITKIASEIFTPMYLAQQFFDKYPQMEQYAPVVAHMVTKIKQKEPNKSPREIMNIVENEISNMLELINKAKSGEQQSQPPNLNIGQSTKNNVEESFIDKLIKSNPDNETLKKLNKLGW